MGLVFACAQLALHPKDQKRSHQMDTATKKTDRHPENQTNPKDREKNDMLAALEFVLAHTPLATVSPLSFLCRRQTKRGPQFLRLARKAIKDAKDSALRST